MTHVFLAWLNFVRRVTASYVRKNHSQPNLVSHPFAMAMKRAKRISSLFSLGSNGSDKSSDPIQPPPLPTHAPSSPKGSDHVEFETQNESSSNLQTPSRTLSLETPPDYPPPPPPPPPPLLLQEDNDVSDSPQGLSDSPQLLSPTIEDGFLVVNRTRSKTESITGSYTNHIGNNGLENQAENSADVRPRSRMENKSGGRPSSPPKMPQYRSPSDSKLLRRSWLSTKSKPDPQSEGNGASPPSTWILHPETEEPYDTSSLMRFEKVSAPLNQDMGQGRIITQTSRCLSFGRIMAIQSYIFIRGPQA